MKRVLVEYRNSAFRQFIRKHEKYAPILFFVGGFIFDSLTLGRIDRLYDLSILSMHITSLTVCLYLFNRVADGIFINTKLEPYTDYFPLAIQFFFGALSSAYVVYFSRSVSLSKTAYFFGILLALLFANEFLKKRISNKYLQFGIYSFLSFTFFASMLPIFLKEMNTGVFLISGTISLCITLVLILIVYQKSLTTRKEVSFGKLVGVACSVYAFIGLCYFFRLIPPVPMALDQGIVAHNIVRKDAKFIVSYEPEEWYVFWREHNDQFTLKPSEKVYIFSSIFAPSNLEKSIYHRWKWYNSKKDNWELIEDIGYQITGGRDDGFRGYTYKSHVKEGRWKVEVLTAEELVLGVIKFEIIDESNSNPRPLIKGVF